MENFNILKDSVSLLSGVGVKRASMLNNLGINTIEDLLLYYPFRYDDISVKNIKDIYNEKYNYRDNKIAIHGKVISQPIVKYLGYKKSKLTFNLLVNKKLIHIVFFNRPYLINKIKNERFLTIYGKLNDYNNSFNGIKILNREFNFEFNAVYHSSKELKNNQIQKLIFNAYKKYENYIIDIIPTNIRDKYNLDDRKKMIYDIHFPRTHADLLNARRSAIFEEFFVFEMKILLKKKNYFKYNGSILYNNNKLKAFISKLPFELTNDQKRVVNEICRDIRLPKVMNRLLQGDVGSGKTIVAAIIMYAVVTSGYQAALMVPTEVLAQQHAEKLNILFEDYNINTVLMTSTTLSNKKYRQNVLKRLLDNDIHIAIGTHSIIQNDVKFNNLGLVITDEEHRFGVNQRKMLNNKGNHPNFLSMTATPIPRTMAITKYGDMDLSIINELPSGRKKIKTFFINRNKISLILSFLKKKLNDNSQAYIVSPLINKSSNLEIDDAKSIYQKLTYCLGDNYKIGLLHGKLNNHEKSKVMLDFKNHRYDVLVTTTVIEVGIDVPNASIMIILNADRFGLDQLHQLRGRVGRNDKQSYCFLISDSENEISLKKLKIMENVSDGFQISQYDLKLRGPGDILGVEQSGLPKFKIGNPLKDYEILKSAYLESLNLFQYDYDKLKTMSIFKYLVE